MASLKTDYSLIREVEIGIERRLGRKALLDHLSCIELEQLAYLIKTASDDYLTKTFNETTPD